MCMHVYVYKCEYTYVCVYVCACIYVCLYLYASDLLADVLCVCLIR